MFTASRACGRCLRRHSGSRGPGPRHATLLLAAVAAAFAGILTAAPRVLVVSSDDAPQLRAGLIGVREALGTTPVEEIARDGNLKARIEAAALQGENVAVIALGRGAAARAARAAPSIATVDCMAAQAAPGAQAVPLDMPAGPQILWLRRLLPAARYIGILYDPAQNADHVDSLAAALRRADFNPVLVPVAAPAMLPAAVGHLPNAVDALLALPDTTVYTPQTAKGLLLFSFRHKLPLIGPSEAWVKAGALYALVWDYREVGAFCARLALRRLLGAGAAAPPQPHVVVNERTAALLRLRWDASIRQAFGRVPE